MFEVEPSTHGKIIDDYINTILCELFPMPEKIPRNPAISEQTMELISKKADLLLKKKAAGINIKNIKIKHPIIIPAIIQAEIDELYSLREKMCVE